MTLETQIGVSASAAVHAVATEHLGIKEWPGAKHNPEVLKFGPLAGIDWFTNDEIPWCAIFVNAMLAMCNIPGTGSAMARSFMKWGEAVPVNSARPGDVVVFPRGAPPAGHVGLVDRIEGATIYVLGGNQGNEVSIRARNVADILPNGVRRWDGSGAHAGRPTIRLGDHGAFVLDLQDQLAKLGYFAGRKDGDFGPLTRAAVMRLQAASGLETDGVVGPASWAALAEAEPAPARQVGLADLRARGSRSIKGADRIDLAAAASAVVGAGTMANDVIAQADSVAGGVKLLVEQYGLWIVGGALVLGILFYASNQIKEARLDDATSGANLRR